MTAEYLETTEKVLLHLKAHPDAKEEDVESMSGIYWAEIRDYLKERRVVMYSGAQWYHVRTRFIDGCLDEIRIAKRKMAEEEKERKAERRRNLRHDVFCAVIGSVVTIAAQAAWDALPFNDGHNDKTEQPSQNKQDYPKGRPDTLQFHKNLE